MRQKQYKKVFGKRIMHVLVADKSTDHDKPCFDFYVFFFGFVFVVVVVFFTTKSTSKKVCLFRARGEKGIARHIDWFLHGSYPGLFSRPPRFSPHGGGRKESLGTGLPTPARFALASIAFSFAFVNREAVNSSKT